MCEKLSRARRRTIKMYNNNNNHVPSLCTVSRTSVYNATTALDDGNGIVGQYFTYGIDTTAKRSLNDCTAVAAATGARELVVALEYAYL